MVLNQSPKDCQKIRKLYMYRLGNIPSPTDNLSDIADYIEIKCLFSDSSSISRRGIFSSMSMESDEQNFDGVEDDEDRLNNKLDDVLQEMLRRKSECAGHYPFKIDGCLVSVDDTCNETIKTYYTYFLLATRSNMREDRLFDTPTKDASLLFEKVSEKIAKNYFGENSKTLLFGTSAGSNFKSKVNHLIKILNLRGEAIDPIGSTGRQNDGHLDLVVWTPFIDNRDSMLIGFGQCKTGTSWEEHLTELNPNNFFKNYVGDSPAHPPVRLFFLTDSISIVNEKWGERASAAGILFDRRRIMEFLPIEDMPNELTNDIKKWMNFIKDKYHLAN